jgi:hypothetical protein
MEFSFDRDYQTLAVWLAVIATALGVVVHIIKKVRQEPENKELERSKLLIKFRDLHSQGVLNDQEYRTIKTTLGVQKPQELKDNDEKG